MPPAYLAAAVLVLGAAVISHRRPSAPVAQDAIVFVFVIALFTALLVVAYLGVIAAAWPGCTKDQQ